MSLENDKKYDAAGGTKLDTGKNRLDLLSPTWVEGVGLVLTFGAKKYADHNWRKGISQSRLLGACLRHVFAYLRGEDVDPETRLSHLLHASCCIMFAFELKQTRPDLDDRYKTPVKRERLICAVPRCHREVPESSQSTLCDLHYIGPILPPQEKDYP